MDSRERPKFKRAEVGLIPEEWQVDKVKDVCMEIFSGGTPNTQNPAYWGRDIPWLSSGETGQTFVRDTEKKITRLGVENSSTRLAKVGDVVVASAGQGYTRGQTALCMIDTYINQSVVSLRVKKESMTPLFLFYNLSSRYNELRQISDAHSSRGSLTTKLLAGLSIQVPPIPEQEGIDKILSEIDFKIELNTKMNKTLEAIGQAIFKRWFVDFEFPNEEGKLYKSSGGEMIFDEHFGKAIPADWELRKIGEVLATVLGGTPDRTNPEYWGGNVPWINSGKVNEFRITEPTEYITKKGLENSATKLLPRRTTVLAITGATLGQVSLLEIESCANQSVVGILESKEIPSEYIYFWIKRSISSIVAWQTGGAQQHINKQNVNDSPLLIPSAKSLANYLKLVRPMFDKIALNCFEGSNLAKIRGCLLPKLMSGKIRVPVPKENVEAQ